MTHEHELERCWHLTDTKLHERHWMQYRRDSSQSVADEENPQHKRHSHAGGGCRRRQGSCHASTRNNTSVKLSRLMPRLQGKSITRTVGVGAAGVAHPAREFRAVTSKENFISVLLERFVAKMVITPVPYCLLGACRLRNVHHWHICRSWSSKWRHGNNLAYLSQVNLGRLLLNVEAADHHNAIDGHCVCVEPAAGRSRSYSGYWRQ